MLCCERLSSPTVFKYYSPELPSLFVTIEASLTGSCGALFIQYRSHGAKLETVSRWEGDHLLSGIGMHEDGVYWISRSARPEPTPCRSMLWASWPGTRTADRGMLRDPINDTVAPSHSICLRGSGYPAPFLPPPFTKSQIKRGAYIWSQVERR